MTLAGAFAAKQAIHKATEPTDLPRPGEPGRSGRFGSGCQTIYSEKGLESLLALWKQPDGSLRSDSHDPLVGETVPAEDRAGKTCEMGAPLGPVQAGMNERTACGPDRNGIKVQVSIQPAQTVGRDGKSGLLVQEPLLAHRVGHGDAEPTGEMIIARSRPGHGRAFRGGPQ